MNKGLKPLKILTTELFFKPVVITSIPTSSVWEYPLHQIWDNFVYSKIKFLLIWYLVLICFTSEAEHFS